MVFLAHQLTNSLAHYTSFIYTGGAAAYHHPLNLVNLLNPLNPETVKRLAVSYRNAPFVFILISHTFSTNPST